MYVLSCLREISGGSLRIYDGTAASFRDPGHAHKAYVQFTEENPFWVENLSPLLELHRLKCVKKYISFWGERVKHIWPELAHLPEDRHEEVVVPEKKVAYPSPDDIEEWSSDAEIQPAPRASANRKKRRRTDTCVSVGGDSPPHRSASISLDDLDGKHNDDASVADSTTTQRSSWSAWGNVHPSKVCLLYTSPSPRDA